MRKIILTALNDDDEFYYRYFIPFILSLKRTDYDGDIGVINYGLSIEKIQKIKQNNILIFSGENRFYELLIDRQTTVALIAEQYNYEQIALYDADIWFTSRKCTIFEQIKNNENLYCTYDVAYPSFLTACIPECNYNAVNLKLDTLIKKVGYFYQVGVIIGGRQGWRNYRNYIINDLYNLNGYKMLYGVDTTAINLYAVDKENIESLPKKYNCLPFFGVKTVTQYKQNQIHFEVDNEVIESLHITRNHRNNRRYYEYSYFSFNLKDYLTLGKSFCSKHLPLMNYTKDKSWLIHSDYKQPQLLVEELSTVAVRSRIDHQGILFEPNDIIIEFASNTKLVLRNTNKESVSFNFILQELINSHYPAFLKVWINNKSLTIINNHSYLLTLQPEDTFTFVCDDVWQTDYGIRLILSNINIY